MPKIITSPVKHFPGTVTLSDPLTFPQLVEWDRAISNVGLLGKDAIYSEAQLKTLPGLFACVEEWHIEGISERPTEKNFPAVPRKAVSGLIVWLIDEINALQEEAEEIPNA